MAVQDQAFADHRENRKPAAEVKLNTLTIRELEVMLIELNGMISIVENIVNVKRYTV